MTLREMTPQEIEWLKALTAGKADSEAGNHKKAIRLLEKAQTIATQFNLSAEILLQTNMYLGIALLQANESARAEIIYRYSLEYAKKNDCIRTPVYMLLMAELGKLIFKKRKFDESSLLFEKYTELYKSLNVQIKEDFLYIQVCRCVCYMEMRDWVNVEKLSRVTRDTSVRLLGEVNICSRQSKQFHLIAMTKLNAPCSRRGTTAKVKQNPRQ